MRLVLQKSILKACSLQLLILCFVGILYYNIDKYSFETKNILEIFFLLIVVESICLHTYFHRTWKNIDNLFIALFFFFLGSRFLFDLCSEKYNVCYFEFFLNRYVSVNIVNRAILNLIIALCSYNIGSLLWRCRHKYIKKGGELIRPLDNVLSDRTVYSLLIIGFLAKGYFAYQAFMAILTYGYLSFFIGGLEINRNLLLMFCETFYEIAIFIIISRNKKLKQVEIWAIIMYVLFSLGTGQRGLAMLSVVFILFYIYKLSRIKLKLPYIIGMVLLLFFVAVSMSSIRGNKELDIQEIANSFFDFFYGQAISITVLVATIDYESQIHFSFWDLFGHIRYLLTYYWEKITLQPSVPIDALTLQADEYKWYGQYISSLLNQEMYYQGLGLGSSYTGQLFAVGKELAQFIGGIFVGYLASFLYQYLKSMNYLKRFWAFHALTIFIFIPRANLSEFISMQWAAYITSALLFFYFVIRNRFKRI